MSQSISQCKECGQARASRGSVLALSALLSCALMLGCAESRNVPASVSGHLPDLQFNLQRSDREAVDAAAYRGKVVLLYFGFTRCMDVCPTTMLRLTQAVAAMPSHSSDVTTLFVSVDPSHDSQIILQNYLVPFDQAHPVGLRGSAAQLETLAKRYRLAYRAAESAGDSAPVHGNAVLVFDRAGRARYLIAPDDTPSAIAAMLDRLADAGA